MNVLIIEDEPLAANHLARLVTEIKPEMKIISLIDSVKRSVAWLGTHAMPDLIFMDIQLADGLSFEIFDQVNVECPVIFTTAYNEYALKAFKVNSIDYILKPVDKMELSGAFKKYDMLMRGGFTRTGDMMSGIGNAVLMLTKKYKERFIIKVGEHLKSVEVTDVLFFFSLDKATFAQTHDGRKFILDFTLEQLSGLVDPKRFFRINRKYMVAPDAIRAIISHTNSRLKLNLKTSDYDDVIVARERVQEFKDWLDR